MTRKYKERSLDEKSEVVPVDDHIQFRSFDLGLSAALISAGFSLISLDKGDQRKVQFIFRRSDGIDSIVEKYWDDKLEIRARTYFDALKMLKNRIYSE